MRLWFNVGAWLGLLTLSTTSVAVWLARLEGRASLLWFVAVIVAWLTYLMAFEWLERHVRAHSARPSKLSRAYADVAREHSERGDEDPPLYNGTLPRAHCRCGERTPAECRELRCCTRQEHRNGLPPLSSPAPVPPWKRSRRQRMSELAAEDLRRMGYEAIPHEEPKIDTWEDGVRLTDQATQDLLREVFGDEPPDAG